jgi:hypothetical protein
VADLHFRMQTTEAKVASFLQIIVSMHAALFSDSAEVNEEEDQHSEPGQAELKQMRARKAPVELRTARKLISDGTTSQYTLRKSPGQEIFSPCRPVICQVSKF